MANSTLDQIRRIAERHSLVGEPERLVVLGMDNDVWRVGETIIRVSGTWCQEGAAAESLLVPAAVEAGIPTPRLIAYDDRRDLVPVAYTIYKRVEGETLGTSDLLPEVSHEVVRQLGREIAKIHRIPKPVDLRVLEVLDRAYVESSIRLTEEADAVDADGAAWCRRWLDKLAPALDQCPTVVTHNDIHPWNLFIDGQERLSWILDWGDGGIGDPTRDFCGFPFWAIPIQVEAYRGAGAELDRFFEGRLLARWLALALWDLRELSTDSNGEWARHWWRWPEGGIEEIERLCTTFGKQWEPWLPTGQI
jgi:hygromycin-B 7''-O-kinase